MRGAEGVVDVDVGERRVALGQLLVVLRLALLVADVLEHHDVPVGHVVEVARELDGLAQQLLQAVGRGPQRELRLAVLRAPEVRGEHEPRVLVAQLAQRRQRRPDAGVVGDVALLVERDVEVHADEHALAGDVEIVERAQVDVPYATRSPTSTLWASSTQRLE